MISWRDAHEDDKLKQLDEDTYGGSNRNHYTGGDLLAQTARDAWKSLTTGLQPDEALVDEWTRLVDEVVNQYWYERHVVTHTNTG